MSDLAPGRLSAPREEDEARAGVERVRGQTWLLVVQTGSCLNGALLALGLLMRFAEGHVDLERVLELLPCAATWASCTLCWLCHRSRRPARPQPEDSSASGPRRGETSYARQYAAVMVVLTAASCVHPGALRSPVSALNRLALSTASLHTLQASLWNLISGACRISSLYLHGRGAREDLAAFVFAEVSTVLAAVLATHAVSRMCEASASRGAGSEASMSDSMQLHKRQRSEADSEMIGLSSILHSSYDAVVFVDAQLLISRPAPALALMLGYDPFAELDPIAESNMGRHWLGACLPVQPPHESKETTRFLQALHGLAPSADVHMAPQIPISLVAQHGDLVRVHCAYASLSGQHEQTSAGYILALSAVSSLPAMISPKSHQEGRRDSASSARDSRDVRGEPKIFASSRPYASTSLRTHTWQTSSSPTELQKNQSARSARSALGHAGTPATRTSVSHTVGGRFSAHSCRQQGLQFSSTTTAISPSSGRRAGATGVISPSSSRRVGSQPGGVIRRSLSMDEMFSVVAARMDECASPEADEEGA